MNRRRYILLIVIILSITWDSQAQRYAAFQQEAAEALSALKPEHLNIRDIKVRKLRVPKEGTIILEMNREFSYLPFRKELVKQAYDTIRAILPSALKGRKISIRAGGYEIGRLIPYAMHNKRFTTRCTYPLVTLQNRLYTPTRGLQNRHIALWQSHGYYFEQTLNRWEWQRARLFGTVEDIYTQTYVMPFLIPMLENAGAYVLSPRDRDISTIELIADNDKEGSYSETGKWNRGGKGFAHTEEYYIDTQNPFINGTYRYAPTTVNANNEAKAYWETDIPQSGNYAVYVAYRTVNYSAHDARYTVYHQGGKSTFKVNQRMGGGTWIYLGHFDFAAGEKARVELSNFSSEHGKIVTADAVKIGGGYSNIARRVNDTIIAQAIKKGEELSHTDYAYTTSGYPRFTEAARYWLQWAGFPEKVYSTSKGQNDYTDDYKSRGAWVNYLAGGSEVLPDSSGLNIPIDLAFAFHTDAGTAKCDSTIGTLGIYFTGKERKVYKRDVPRQVSRYLTDEVMTQVTEDIRHHYDSTWSRRGLWNKSYFEARVPEVPTMLLELLSHQNFNDMRYGLDPRFRFVVSRSVYKGILKFISRQRNESYVVQPLPVSHLHTRWEGESQARLAWRPVRDALEPTASPEKYIVYTRLNGGSFDSGTLVDDTTYTLNILPNTIYSFKVTAVNQGGESFPSEILSLGKASQEKGTVMIINGFNRVSGPQAFSVDSTLAGFHYTKDFGVPYLKDIGYTGEQYEYRTSEPWVSDDNPGCGASKGDYETKVIAGNTFDYPYCHGQSILRAGYSFVSSSEAAVSKQLVNLNHYPFVDLILGKEKRVWLSRKTEKADFPIFSPSMRKVLTKYCSEGRNLLVSGAYLASDLWDKTAPDYKGQQFAQKVLHYSPSKNKVTGCNRVVPTHSSVPQFGNLSIEFYNTLNETCYAVESPDGIEPAGEGCLSVQQYDNTQTSAAVFYAGNQYNTCILGYPFETVQSEEQRDALMQAILNTFCDNTPTHAND